MSQWVSLEANIAAGKSTLQARLLKLLPDVVRINEPVEKWCASGVLERAYAEPKTWNFPAQCYFFHTRISEFRRAAEKVNGDVTFFSERSPFSDKLFWQTQIDLERVDRTLGSIYSDMWALWQDLLPVRNPSLFVYIDTPVDECERRMRQRARDEERDVDVEYLTELDKHHRATFLSDTRGARMPDGTWVPVVVIDGSEAFHVNDSVLEKIAAKIKARLP